MTYRAQSSGLLQPSGLSFQDVSLTILHADNRMKLVENVNLTLPPVTMALIGESRLAAVSVLDLICRRLIPQQGSVQFDGMVSWPIGHVGPFSVAVTGTQAISHFAAVYGFDRNHGVAFMKAEFPEPALLNTQVFRWPKTLQNQFGLLMALIPEFHIYLVDFNFILPEDIAFSKRFMQLFNVRRQNKLTLITARQKRVLQAICQGAVVVADRDIYIQENLDEALAISNRIVVKYDPAVSDTSDNTDDGLFF
jgi:capsular polysaccharide transport system ATP-binding protein